MSLGSGDLEIPELLSVEIFGATTITFII